MTAALWAAALAALGYVGRLVVSSYLDWRSKRRSERKSLLDLAALLQASRAIFLVQNAQVRQLTNMIRSRLGDKIEPQHGFERVMSQAHPEMSPEEDELHSLIRSVTEHSMLQLNKSMLEWVQNDVVYRTESRRRDPELAEALLNLETHLLMWIAKYHAWIPGHPEHALVYLADEQAHGPAFPGDLEEIVAARLRHRSRFW